MKFMARKIAAIAAIAAFALAANAGILREAVVEYDGVIAPPSVGNVLTLPTFDSGIVAIAVESKSISSTGIVTYSGRTGSSAYRNATITMLKGGFQATVKNPKTGNATTIRVKDGKVTLREDSPARGGKCGTVSHKDPPRAAGVRTLAAAKLTGDPLVDGAKIMKRGETVTNIIDILMVFDKSAAEWVRNDSIFAGTENAVDTFAADCMERVNSMYANTGLDAYFTFNLAGVMEIEPDLSLLRDEDGDVDSATILDEMTDVKGTYKETYKKIAEMRDLTCSDIVSMLISCGSDDLSGTVGIGYALDDDNIGQVSFCDIAMNVCLIEAVATGNTQAHEIGHNMGAGHAEMKGGENSGPQLYDYSTGYYFEVTNSEGNVISHCATVMAYDSDGYETDLDYGDRWGFPPPYARSPLDWGSGLWEETEFFSSSVHTYRYEDEVNGGIVDSGVLLGDEKHDNTRILSLTYPLAANYRVRKNSVTIVDPTGGAKTLKGMGTYVRGATATLNAAAASGKVFAGWYEQYDDATGEFSSPFVSSDGVDYRNATVKIAFAADGEFEKRVVYARFVDSGEDAEPALAKTMDRHYEFEGGVAIKPVQVAVDSLSLPKVTVAGLPAGLKFDAKTLQISGTPTKAGTFSVKTTIKNSSNTKGAVDNFEIVILDHALQIVRPDGTTVKGEGRYIAGKKVTLGITPAKGNVFGGWYQDGEFTEPAVGAVDYRTAAFQYETTTSDVTFYARVVSNDEDSALTIDVDPAYTTSASGEFDLVVPVTSISVPKLSVKGLPAGLKFDAKSNRISGTAKKPGEYKCQASATNASVKKAVTADFTIVVPNFESEFLPNLDPAGGAYPLMAGLAVSETLLDLTVKEDSGYSVTAVSGLPSGVKFNAKTGTFSGVPTKAGIYTVTVTAKKGSASTVATVTMRVDALPDWAYGSYFCGSGINSLSLTVTAAGKISGKLVEGLTTWTISAPSFTSLECTEVVLKSGKNVETNYLDMTSAPVAIGDVADVFGRAALFREIDEGGKPKNGTARAVGFQNKWKLEPWKTIAKDMAKAPLFTCEPDKGVTITVKVASSGQATVKGTFEAGEGQKKYTASASVPLLPWNGFYGASFYMPPKSGTFEGYGAILYLDWDGKAFSLLAE